MSIDSEQTKKAIAALYTVIEKRTANVPDEKKQLFDEEYGIFLNISLKKTPDKAKVKPFQIPLKHSLYAESDICLFVKDPQEDWRQKLDSVKVKNIKQVISVQKLRKNYREYKDKRQLLSEFQLFLADERILPLLPPLLGVKFFNKKKQPMPVCLTHKSEDRFRAELEKARDSTYFVLPGGPSVSVRIATTSFTKQQVLENILESINPVVEKLPKKWKNVQSIFLKTEDSMALPIYTSLPTGADMMDTTGGSESKADDEDEESDTETTGADGKTENKKKQQTQRPKQPMTPARAKMVAEIKAKQAEEKAKFEARVAKRAAKAAAGEGAEGQSKRNGSAQDESDAEDDEDEAEMTEALLRDMAAGEESDSEGGDGGDDATAGQGQMSDDDEDQDSKAEEPEEDAGLEDEIAKITAAALQQKQKQHKQKQQQQKQKQQAQPKQSAKPKQKEAKQQQQPKSKAGPKKAASNSSPAPSSAATENEGKRGQKRKQPGSEKGQGQSAVSNSPAASKQTGGKKGQASPKAKSEKPQSTKGPATKKQRVGPAKS